MGGVGQVVYADPGLANAWATIAGLAYLLAPGGRAAAIEDGRGEHTCIRLATARFATRGERRRRERTSREPSQHWSRVESLLRELAALFEGDRSANEQEF